MPTQEPRPWHSVSTSLPDVISELACARRAQAGRTADAFNAFNASIPAWKYGPSETAVTTWWKGRDG